MRQAIPKSLIPNKMELLQLMQQKKCLLGSPREQEGDHHTGDSSLQHVFMQKAQY